MKTRVANLFRSQVGAISMDWIILTGALVGTGVAVVSNLGDGASQEAYDTSRAIAAGQVRGQIVLQSQGARGCAGGIDRLQVMTGNHSEPGLLARIAGMADGELQSAMAQMRPMKDRDETLMTALECEMVSRGFGQ